MDAAAKLKSEAERLGITEFAAKFWTRTDAGHWHYRPHPGRI
jgi:hypothetical protein